MQQLQQAASMGMGAVDAAKTASETAVGDESALEQLAGALQ
jgi:hypothetical protein